MSLLTFVLGRQPNHALRFPLLHIGNPNHVGALGVCLAWNRLHVNQVRMRDPPFKAAMIGYYLLVGPSAVFACLARLYWEENINFTELL